VISTAGYRWFGVPTATSGYRWKEVAVVPEALAINRIIEMLHVAS